jgi:hypothetical protein
MKLLHSTVCVLLFAILVLSGCSTPNSPDVEKGLHGTIAYHILIEASEPGTKIEVNHQMVGVVPVTVKVFGDRDGTFHNFGSDEYVIRGFPPREDFYSQTKIFKTGTFGIKDDKIPQKVFFQFSSTPANPR